MSQAGKAIEDHHSTSSYQIYDRISDAAEK